MIPAAWIITQKEMGAMKPPLWLCATDQSYIIDGDMSISHCLKLIKTHDKACPDGSTTGFKLVKQLGEWTSVNHAAKFCLYKIDDQLPPSKKPTTTARTNWDKITNTLTQSSINWFFDGSTDLLIPRSQCHDNTEKYIIALAQTCKFTPSSYHHDNSTWATDGSMIPATSGISDRKSITAAVTGPATLILQIKDRNASILQGEQMGLLAALILTESTPQIYTDHMNSTTLVDDSCTAINQERQLHMMNGQSYH